MVAPEFVRAGDELRFLFWFLQQIAEGRDSYSADLRLPVDHGRCIERDQFGYSLLGHRFMFGARPLDGGGRDALMAALLDLAGRVCA